MNYDLGFVVLWPGFVDRQRKKTEEKQNWPKNSTIKPLSTICTMYENQGGGGHGPPLPTTMVVTSW